MKLVAVVFFGQAEWQPWYSRVSVSLKLDALMFSLQMVAITLQLCLFRYDYLPHEIFLHSTLQMCVEFL